MDVKIKLMVEGEELSATLLDNATSRDLLSLLPANLTFRDYAGTEKVADLPRRLTTEGAPPGMDPDVGDLTYYAPWGNLAIFYRDFGYANGLVKLGRVDSRIDALAHLGGDFVVHLERAETVRDRKGGE